MMRGMKVMNIGAFCIFTDKEFQYNHYEMLVVSVDFYAIL